MSNHTSKRKENLDRFVGKHFLYTYENGWKYEMYIRNANTIDYRIHSGIVGGRWVNKVIS
jgi:phenolic acid decarboxylase